MCVLAGKVGTVGIACRYWIKITDCVCVTSQVTRQLAEAILTKGSGRSDPDAQSN